MGRLPQACSEAVPGSGGRPVVVGRPKAEFSDTRFLDGAMRRGGRLGQHDRGSIRMVLAR